ncbi:MAG: ATP-dependent helicase [Spirochaetaceae bacterium]|jgi:DNA helicase-2/ATP-dependent DNA helicase PcrA|nr:ATP-dependent helicase [Spirochaetaceae bacterium]
MEYPGYLRCLNAEQREAALHTGKPLLILAGAGAGKTRVITSKIAYFIQELGCAPQSILAVTFTNKAAREMQERACALDSRAGNVMIRTFHSFGAWFLRRYGYTAGLMQNFTIYDDSGSESLVSKALATGVAEHSGGIRHSSSRSDVKTFAHNIALAKDYLYSPENAELSLINHGKQFPAIYAEYEKALAQSGNVDFGDLIKKPVEILKSNEELAAHIRSRFRIIFVDEYQDANIAQFELLKALFGKAGSEEAPYLCVVGDDDQSIYRFRGAEVKNILQFREQFGGADQIKLERNYRSKQEILSLANSVIAHNKGRLGKALIAERGSGSLPRLVYVDNQDKEAAFCAELIAQSVKNGAKYADWAILYRTNAQSRKFEIEFLREKIPYRIIGSLKFYEREEIKDALSLLAFTINPRDEFAFRRVINKPARGLGKAALEKITAAAASPEIPEDIRWNLEEACLSVKDTLSAKAKNGLQEFLSALKHARALLLAETPMSDSDTQQQRHKNLIKASERSLAGCVAVLLNETGLAEYYHDSDEEASEERLNNLQGLVNDAVSFPRSAEGLVTFLDRIELDKSLDTAEDESQKDRVNLITLHNTKGMEFKRVVITACEQGVFPRDGKKGEDLEEERRLFYVGATRAMDELYFTCAESRFIFGEDRHQTPSIFLKEADSDFLETIDRRVFLNSWPRGLYSERGGFSGVSSAFAKRYGGKNGWGISRNAVSSSDGRWTVGDRLFHDDEGYGGVCAIEETEDGPVIKAQFETGRVRHFLSESQSGAFMKIKD